MRDFPLKAAAVGLFGAGFVAAGWPIISSVVTSGGCQWHVFLLGLTDPFNETLGVSGGAYSWGHLYNDEYLWATVSGYATRFRPDLGYIEYCSHEYDVASWQYLRHILVTFPADFVTRAYASALQVLDLPFHRFDVLKHAGPLLAAVFVLAVGSASLRLALFAAFVILYFGGYPAIQFMPRHYFPFEFMTVAILAFLIERGARAGRALARERRADRPASMPMVRSVAVCAAILAAVLLVPLGLLRWYQNTQASRLLGLTWHRRPRRCALEAGTPGRFRLPDDNARKLSPDRNLRRSGPCHGALRPNGNRRGACRPGTTVTFQYDPTYPATDFSQTVSLKTATRAGQPTRLFEPVYAGFRGIEVSDPSPACAPRVSVVDDLDRLPLLLSVQLTPGWESQPQYQRIAHQMKTIVHVIGARPNYMKIAPLMDALRAGTPLRQVLVNTGSALRRHDGARVRPRSRAARRPDYDLGVGSASHAVQTAKVMIEFEQVCLAERPDLVVVVGDVNSTMAASLVAAKLLIPVAHVEAGLRSSDRTMPEEINRVVTDRISDLLLTPSPDADENLLAEGVPAEKIHLVGNIMIDSLLRHLPMATLERVRDRIAGGREALRRSHAAPAVECRQRGGVPPDSVGDRHDCRTPAGCVSGASPHASADARVRHRLRARECHPHGSAGLHRFSRPDVPRASGADRFGRPAGGIDRAGDSVPDAAREHRASDHRQPGHQ